MQPVQAELVRLRAAGPGCDRIVLRCFALLLHNHRVPRSSRMVGAVRAAMVGCEMGMGYRFNPPPNWPAPPPGWVPSPGWRPSPEWPAPPPGWQLWIDDMAPGPSSAASGTASSPQTGVKGSWTSDSAGRDPYSNPGGQPPSGLPSQLTSAPLASPTQHRRRKRHRLRTALLAVGGLVIVIIVVGASLAVGKHSSGGSLGASAGSSPSAATASSAVATAALPPPSASANPLVNWSSTCITLADELQSSPYDFTYTTSGTTINWNIPPILTYGQLGNLGSGTHGNKNDLAHLSYLAYTVDNSSQLANDLGDAGMATINPADGIVPQTVNGVSIYDNSAYDQLQGEQVPASDLSAWANTYLMPVLNDCAAGD
jgi:hypothetical protein